MIRTADSIVYSSLIVEYLRTEALKRPNFTLAYFYFNCTSQSDTLNNYRTLLCSLLFQIACSSRQCWDYFRQERVNSHGLSHPTNEQAFEMLHHLLGLSGPTVVVIDALDECQSRDPRTVGEQDAMLAFLARLYRLRFPNLRLLLTSRPETKILRRLEGFDTTRSNLDLQLDPGHQADLAAYIDERLSQQTFERWGEVAREKARKALGDPHKSQGMLVRLLSLAKAVCSYSSAGFSG